MPVLLYTCTQVKVVYSTLPLGGTLKKVGWKRALLTPAIILTFLVVVAYGTDPGIAPFYLVPWALLTWGWVLGLPSAGHHMSLGGKSGSKRNTVLRNMPCQWISYSQSSMVYSVKMVIGQRGSCPWGFTILNGKQYVRFFPHTILKDQTTLLIESISRKHNVVTLVPNR